MQPGMNTSVIFLYNISSILIILIYKYFQIASKQLARATMKKRLLSQSTFIRFKLQLVDLLNQGDNQQQSHPLKDALDKNREVDKSSETISPKRQDSDEQAEQISAEMFKNILPVDESKRKKKSLIKLKNIIFDNKAYSLSQKTQCKFNRSQIQSLQRLISDQSQQVEPQNQIKQYGSVQQKSRQSIQQEQEIIWQSQPNSKIKIMNNIEQDIKLRTPTLTFSDKNAMKNIVKISKKSQTKKKKIGKEKKVGKKKDKISNQVFNAIEDYFM